MAALVSLLVVLAVSGASAFLGVGFTTRGSEQVLDHPVRRRIAERDPTRDAPPVLGRVGSR
jgi:hypothetical protein